jgi:putative membrane protein
VGAPATAAAHLSAAEKSTGSAVTGAKSLAAGATSVKGGIAQVHAGASDLADGATALQAGWAGVHSVLTSDGRLGAGLTALTDAQEQLTTGASGLTTGAEQLADPATLIKAKQLTAGADKLAAALTTMSTASSDSSTGIPALQSGLAQLVAGFDNGDPEQGLISGATALRDGSADLASGLKAANAGAVKVSSGSSKIAANTPELASGLDDAQAGAAKLGTKLADGAGEIPEDTAAVRNDRADAVTTPVTLDASHVWEADSWGEGFAPFFISLALWVGALITWLLLRPLQTRALMTSVNGFRMAWGSLNSALLLSLGQVVIMLSVMHFAVGLNPHNVLATFCFTMLAAAAFFALQQFFQVTLGSAVGKVVIIVMLMVQLASAGGTYPIQTTPSFLQVISPYMPMTYVVNGLREAITGGIEGRFWTSVAVLATIFVVSLAATSIASARKRMWTMSRLHPALSI